MKYKTARQWYSSRAHFRSEKSWEEYKKSAQKRTSRRPARRVRRQSCGLFGNNPFAGY